MNNLNPNLIYIFDEESINECLEFIFPNLNQIDGNFTNLKDFLYRISEMPIDLFRISRELRTQLIYQDHPFLSQILINKVHGKKKGITIRPINNYDLRDIGNTILDLITNNGLVDDNRIEKIKKRHDYFKSELDENLEKYNEFRYNTFSARRAKEYEEKLYDGVLLFKIIKK